MAEGWACRLLGEWIEAHSAGIAPGTLDPRAVAVMREEGVDISGHRAKALDELHEIAFDLVITVCDRTSESCPRFPGTTSIIHHGFDDPPHLAAAASSEAEALDHYRRVRDEIRAFIESCSRLPEVCNLERQASKGPIHGS